MEGGLEHREGIQAETGQEGTRPVLGQTGGVCGGTGDVRADYGCWADRRGKGRLLYVKGTMPCSTPFSILSTQSTYFRQIPGMWGAHVEGGPFKGLDFWKEIFLL